jgi:hypothetical protein
VKRDSPGSHRKPLLLRLVLQRLSSQLFVAALDALIR